MVLFIATFRSKIELLINKSFIKNMLRITHPQFAIVGYDSEKSSYANIGTGFFVNNSGGFVTAAHTVKNTARKYFAVLEDEFYQLPEAKLFLNREIEEQVPPVHEDIYIGQFDFLESSFYKLRPVSKLKENDLLTFRGFASVAFSDGFTVSKETIAEIAYQAKLKANGFLKEYELNRIHISSLSGKFVRNGFNRLTFLSRFGEITNGFSFVLTSNIDVQDLIKSNPIIHRGQDPSGYSGGPVIFEGDAIGMLITQNAGLTSDYLIEKLDELQIKYTISV